MILAHLQDSLSSKLIRQKHLSQKYPDLYKLDHCGICSHVGRLSPGCGCCFDARMGGVKVNLPVLEGLPVVCNCDCPSCFEPAKEVLPGWTLDPDWRMPAVSKERLLRTPLSGTEAVYTFTPLQTLSLCSTSVQ